MKPFSRRQRARHFPRSSASECLSTPPGCLVGGHCACRIVILRCCVVTCLPCRAVPVRYVEIIFKRLFRVFAILYCTHLKAITESGAIAHLNTCFRHFMYFVFVFHLVESRELKALPGLTQRIRKEYKELKHQRKEAMKKHRDAAKKAAASSNKSPGGGGETKSTK